MKRITSVILCAFVACAAVSHSFAASETVNGITWIYTVSNGTASIGGGSSSATAVPTATTGAITIPSSLGGYPVMSIGDGAFSGYSGLASVTIPDSVTSIGNSAFCDCSELQKVTIGASLTHIGNYAFYGCWHLTGVYITDIASWCGISFGSDDYYFGSANPLEYAHDLYLNGSLVTDLVIPDGVSNIAPHAFCGCNLTSVTIPNSVTSVGDCAFSSDADGPGSYIEYNMNLTNVTIGAGVTNIGSRAFYRRHGLSSVSIPNSVARIGQDAFSACNNDITTIPGVELVDGWAVGNSGRLLGHLDLTMVRGIADHAFYECWAVTSVAMPDNIVNIGDETFYGCSGLTSVTIPERVTIIGDSAFGDCNGLTSVTIPDSVTSIGNSAFSSCDGLTTVTIGRGVTSIGDYAFSAGDDCIQALASVFIPNNVTNIGSMAFSDWPNLVNARVPKALEKMIIERSVFKYCSQDLVVDYYDVQTCNFPFGIKDEVDIGLYGYTVKGLPKGLTYSAITGKLSGTVNNAGVYEVTFSKNGESDVVVQIVVRKAYTVTFDANGGMPKTQRVSLFPESSFVLPDDPTRVGYAFTGWWTEKNGGAKVTESTTFSEGAYAQLYAQWEANRYAVAFDANGGTGAMDAQQMVYDVAAPLFGNDFALPGSLLRGWATSADGDVVYMDGADVKNLSAIDGDVVTLFAVWQKKPDWVLACEASFGEIGRVSLDGNDNIVVTLTNDVSGTVEIPDNVGAVTIDLNGYVMTGDDGPAIRIVKGDGEGAVTLEATKLAIVDTSDGESGRITGGGESAGIEIAEDAALRVRLDVEDDVGVFNGDGSEQDWRALSPVEFTLTAGEYFKATLAELGYDVPTDRTAYNVVAKGLPAGLKLMYNKAVTKKVKGKTVVVKAAKSEWWIEGVPTAAVDFFTNPPYLVITANGETTTEVLPVEVAAQEVVDLGELELGQSINTNGWLSGVGAGWTVSGLPTGLKYTPSVVYVNPKAKKKVVKYPAYSVYGKTTKAGLFTITAKKKKGAYYETMKYRVLVRPKAVDTEVFGEALTNITMMAYVPVEWDLRNDVASVGGKVAKVAGLPTGLTFAAANTYAYKNAKKKTGKYLKQYGQTIIGTPTKTGTYVVTFTKNVTTGTGKNTKTVAKTAQILWTVVANDAELELGFNTAGGVVESGVVGLKYDGLMAFTATSNATVTASGMPAGVKLANLDNGQYAFTGFTTKAGTYLVTVKATLNGKTVTQRVALEVEGLPTWAKGTFNGYVTGDVQGSDADEQQLVPPGGIYGLATITVSAAGKVSGKFHELGTNWTFSAASYTGYDETAPAYTVPVTAKYPYKVPEKVKSGKKTVTTMVTKYVTRTMTLTVGADALGGVATLAETDGSAVVAWQNRWGSTYKAVGTKLFTTKSDKKTLAYKTFTIKGTTEEGAAIGLMASETLSLKVTPNGAVAATLSFDTGKTKKDAKTKKVIYKATCNTVVIPTSPADADPFTGEVCLYFAPSPANGFPGYVGVLPF